MPFRSNEFDVVIANHKVYHAADKPRALAHIRRVLKPGGRFLASTNGLSHMREVAEWFTGVDVRRYPDELLVTDASALSDFILSASTIFTLDANRKAALRDFIHIRLEELGGTFRIQKDAGLISARQSE